uniref:DNA-directed RNA polymerase subunit beta' n=1 Tax=Koshicola spirodelophila TaxID=1707787 RepID=A0A167MG29_9CHLO|nr:beta subunit of RNA polymerase [Koshicola spirodelophila]
MIARLMPYNHFKKPFIKIDRFGKKSSKNKKNQKLFFKMHLFYLTQKLENLPTLVKSRFKLKNRFFDFTNKKKYLYGKVLQIEVFGGRDPQTLGIFKNLTVVHNPFLNVLVRNVGPLPHIMGPQPYNLLKNKVFFWKWGRGLKLKKRSSLDGVQNPENFKVEGKQFQTSKLKLKKAGPLDLLQTTFNQEQASLKNVSFFNIKEACTIGLASPLQIKKWAETKLPNGKIYGQVINANTLHHRTLKPLKGGLFCERIFGPIKDYECACGIQKEKPIIQHKILNLNKNNLLLKQNFCPKCDVEYTWSDKRRYQLGYIQLASPVAHIWYLKGNPSYISILLDMKKKQAESIVYCKETLTLDTSCNFNRFQTFLASIFKPENKKLKTSGIGSPTFGHLEVGHEPRSSLDVKSGVEATLFLGRKSFSTKKEATSENFKKDTTTEGSLSLEGKPSEIRPLPHIMGPPPHIMGPPPHIMGPPPHNLLKNNLLKNNLLKNNLLKNNLLKNNLLKNKVFFWKCDRGLKLKKRSSLKVRQLFFLGPHSSLNVTLKKPLKKSGVPAKQLKDNNTKQDALKENLVNHYLFSKKLLNFKNAILKLDQSKLNKIFRPLRDDLKIRKDFSDFYTTSYKKRNPKGFFKFFKYSRREGSGYLKKSERNPFFVRKCVFLKKNGASVKKMPFFVLAKSTKKKIPTSLPTFGHSLQEHHGAPTPHPREISTPLVKFKNQMKWLGVGAPKHSLSKWGRGPALQMFFQNYLVKNHLKIKGFLNIPQGTFKKSFQLRRKTSTTKLKDQGIVYKRPFNIKILEQGDYSIPFNLHIAWKTFWLLAYQAAKIKIFHTRVPTKEGLGKGRLKSRAVNTSPSRPTLISGAPTSLLKVVGMKPHNTQFKDFKVINLFLLNYKNLILIILWKILFFKMLLKKINSHSLREHYGAVNKSGAPTSHYGAPTPHYGAPTLLQMKWLGVGAPKHSLSKWGRDPALQMFFQNSLVKNPFVLKNFKNLTVVGQPVSFQRRNILKDAFYRRWGRGPTLVYFFKNDRRKWGRGPTFLYNKDRFFNFRPPASKKGNLQTSTLLHTTSKKFTNSFFFNSKISKSFYRILSSFKKIKQACLLEMFPGLFKQMSDLPFKNSKQKRIESAHSPTFPTEIVKKYKQEWGPHPISVRGYRMTSSVSRPFKAKTSKSPLNFQKKKKSILREYLKILLSFERKNSSLQPRLAKVLPLFFKRLFFKRLWGRGPIMWGRNLSGVWGRNLSGVWGRGPTMKWDRKWHGRPTLVLIKKILTKSLIRWKFTQFLVRINTSMSFRNLLANKKFNPKKQQKNVFVNKIFESKENYDLFFNNNLGNETGFLNFTSGVGAPLSKGLLGPYPTTFKFLNFTSGVEVPLFFSFLLEQKLYLLRLRIKWIGNPTLLRMIKHFFPLKKSEVPVKQLKEVRPESHTFAHLKINDFLNVPVENVGPLPSNPLKNKVFFRKWGRIFKFYKWGRVPTLVYSPIFLKRSSLDTLRKNVKKLTTSSIERDLKKSGAFTLLLYDKKFFAKNQNKLLMTFCFIQQKIKKLQIFLCSSRNFLKLTKIHVEHEMLYHSLREDLKNLKVVGQGPYNPLESGAPAPLLKNLKNLWNKNLMLLKNLYLLQTKLIHLKYRLFYFYCGAPTSLLKVVGQKLYNPVLTTFDNIQKFKKLKMIVRTFFNTLWLQRYPSLLHFFLNLIWFLKEHKKKKNLQDAFFCALLWIPASAALLNSKAQATPYFLNVPVGNILIGKVRCRKLKRVVFSSNSIKFLLLSLLEQTYFVPLCYYLNNYSKGSGAGAPHRRSFPTFGQSLQPSTKNLKDIIKYFSLYCCNSLFSNDCGGPITTTNLFFKRLGGRHLSGVWGRGPTLQEGRIDKVFFKSLGFADTETPFFCQAKKQHILRSKKVKEKSKQYQILKKSRTFSPQDKKITEKLSIFKKFLKIESRFKLFYYNTVSYARLYTQQADFKKIKNSCRVSLTEMDLSFDFPLSGRKKERNDIGGAVNKGGAPTPLVKLKNLKVVGQGPYNPLESGAPTPFQQFNFKNMPSTEGDLKKSGAPVPFPALQPLKKKKDPALLKNSIYYYFKNKIYCLSHRFGWNLETTDFENFISYLWPLDKSFDVEIPIYSSSKESVWGPLPPNTSKEDLFSKMGQGPLFQNKTLFFKRLWGTGPTMQGSSPTSKESVWGPLPPTTSFSQLKIKSEALRSSLNRADLMINKQFFKKLRFCYFNPLNNSRSLTSLQFENDSGGSLPHQPLEIGEGHRSFLHLRSFKNQSGPSFQQKNSSLTAFKFLKKPDFYKSSISGGGILYELLAEYQSKEIIKINQQILKTIWELTQQIQKDQFFLKRIILSPEKTSQTLIKQIKKRYRDLRENRILLLRRLKSLKNIHNTSIDQLGTPEWPIDDSNDPLLMEGKPPLVEMSDSFLRQNNPVGSEIFEGGAPNISFSTGTFKKSFSKTVKLLVRKKNFRPEWMIISYLPVLPPDLRPIMLLSQSGSSSTIAASDLNRLYQKVLYRNERLKRFLKDSATKNSSEMRLCQRLLQEAVDNLIENGKGGSSPETDNRGRPLKSLSDLLKGKKGRFRQNLLGKRVDYSGRSVIVVGPKLRLHQCGLPKQIALELFMPFLIKKIISSGFANTILGAKKILLSESHYNSSITWELLRQIMRQHPILLNRAPTLHRVSIQAFIPLLIEGSAILLHPLVCPAFNADFDGDQMAVHVPISIEARAEAWKMMLARNNMLSPATGEPLILPSQDMVLGSYYLTTDKNIQQTKSGTVNKSGNPTPLQKVSRLSFNTSSILNYLMQEVVGGRGPQTLSLEVGQGPHSSLEEMGPRYPSSLNLTEKLFFSNIEELIKIYQRQHISIHTPIWLLWNKNLQTETNFEKLLEVQTYFNGIQIFIYQKFIRSVNHKGQILNQWIQTTPGRVLFNLTLNNCIFPGVNGALKKSGAPTK